MRNTSQYAMNIVGFALSRLFRSGGSSKEHKRWSLALNASLRSVGASSSQG
jgi:hypothetical protein